MRTENIISLKKRVSKKYKKHTKKDTRTKRFPVLTKKTHTHTSPITPFQMNVTQVCRET